MLVRPPRCTTPLYENLFDENLIAEVKLDGGRYVLYLGEGVDPYSRQRGNTLLSRRVSTIDNKHVDRTRNLPFITDVDYGDLAGTVLDGEVFHTDCATTTSIMGSSPAVALAKQEQIGRASYYVFDCPVYRGKDIRGRPLTERRKILEHVVKLMANENVKLMPQFQRDFAGQFDRIVKAGGEGLIIKDKRLGYGVGWAKMKKSYDVSCFIIGYKPGNGKYSDSIGSIELAVDQDGTPVPVGFASGFDDALRAEFAAKPDQFLYLAVDVFAQEISKDGRLRHCTFFRLREDLAAEDCTMMKLKDDMALKAKSTRRFVR